MLFFLAFVRWLLGVAVFLVIVLSPVTFGSALVRHFIFEDEHGLWLALLPVVALLALCFVLGITECLLELCLGKSIKMKWMARWPQVLRTSRGLGVYAHGYTHPFQGFNPSTGAIASILIFVAVLWSLFVRFDLSLFLAVFFVLGLMIGVGLGDVFKETFSVLIGPRAFVECTLDLGEIIIRKGPFFGAERLEIGELVPTAFRIDSSFDFYEISVDYGMRNFPVAAMPDGESAMTLFETLQLITVAVQMRREERPVSQPINSRARNEDSRALTALLKNGFELVEKYRERRESSRDSGPSSTNSADEGRSGITMSEAYNILGVTPEHTMDQITRIWKKLSQIYHPDVNGGQDKHIKRINQAYQKIVDHRGQRA